MKRICITFATAIILLISTLPLHAQFSTTGKDFWLSFGSNTNTASSTLSFQIRIVTTKPTQVIISFTQIGTFRNFSLKADTVFTYDLTSTEKAAVYSYPAGTSTKSIHIQTDEIVSVFAINLMLNTSDATTILPTPSLGTSYRHLSYINNITYSDGYTVVATENNTTIYENGAVRAMLNKGQVYSLYFANDGSGRQITANNPIAYFVTHQGVQIPEDTGNVDCLYAQLYPETSWGNNFFVPVTIRGVERVRVIASQNGTNITQLGGSLPTTVPWGSQNHLTNLSAGQWVELEIYATQRGCHIRTDKPVGVASYLVGITYPGLTYKQGVSNGMGDPSLTWVPPIEQSINEALLAPFLAVGSSVLKEHYFMIVTPTSAKNLTQISINGGAFTGLSGGTWYDHSSGYSYYNTDSLSTTANVTYKLKNSQGLIVFGYGLGNRESYYYVAGSAIHKLDAYFEVDSIHFQQLNNTTLCYDSVNVEAIVKYTMNVLPGYLRWFVDSVEQPSITDSLSWGKRFSLGKHTISMIATNQFGVRDTMRTSFTIGQKESVTVYDTICQRDSVSVGQKYYKTTGTYKDTLQTVWGCDSVVTLHLVVKDTSLKEISASICEGKTYTDNDFNETQAGIYTKKLKNVLDCDSTVILTLTVNKKDTTFIAVYICKGDTYTDARFTNLTLEGVYYDTLKNKNGCDSLIELTLGYYPNVPITKYAYTLCFDSVYNDANFKNLKIAGTYYDTLKNKNGCDSIIQLDLSFYPQIPITKYADTLCFGKIYNDANFKNLKTAGIYYDTLKNKNGCDSVIQLDLDFYPQVPITKYTDTFCFGEIYNDAHFTNLTQAGTYYDTLPNINACDSIIQLDLVFYSNRITKMARFKPGAAIGQDAMISTNQSGSCTTWQNTNNGNVPEINAVVWTWNANGCGIGTARALLKFDELATIPINAVIIGAELKLYGMPSSTWTSGNSCYSGSGYNSYCPNRVFIQKITSTWNEQTVTWNTQPTTTTNNQIIIPQTTSQWNWNFTDNSPNLITMVQDWVSNPSQNFGVMFKLETEAYYRSMLFASSDHSNSALHPELIVTYETQRSVKDTTKICEGDTYSKNGFNESVMGTYGQNLQDKFGCDSIVILNLSINKKDTTYINASICEGTTYTNNNFKNLKNAGTYYDTLKNKNGCDSILVLTLNINKKDTTYINASICEGTTYTNNNFKNLKNAGTYYDTLKNKNGCDSILVLTLNINKKDTSYFTTSICQYDTYTDDNFTNLTKSGIYYDTLKNINGCDSILILTLTVNKKDTTYLSASTCKGDTYSDDNFTNLSQAGTYYDTLPNINGCDSILILTLTVNLKDTVVFFATLCEGETYQKNGFNESVSDTYTRNLLNRFHCDSVVILNLYVAKKDTIILFDTICDGDTYLKYGFNESKAGDYMQNLSNVYDCDSLVILHLFANDTFLINIFATICVGETYADDNFNETQAGIYTKTYSTINGCDSTILLHLTVKDTVQNIIDATICEGEIYQQNGFNCSETDTYFQHLQTVLGCDSTVILNLYVANKDTNLIFDTICQEETYNQNGFISSETGVYYQNLQNHYGCDSLVVLDLTVNPIPYIEIVPVTDNFCYQHFVELQVITNGDNILWSTGETENPITVTAIAAYFATAYIGYCENTASYTVGECPCYVWLPNSFTPNGDGLNEVYKPEIVCPGGFKDYKLIIYDRLGNRIFQSFDYAVGWDGTDGKGKTYSDGSYSCILEYTDSKNKRIVKNTAVTVFR